MGLALSDWMVYTMWAVLGLLLLNVVIGLVQAFWTGTLDPTFVLDALKEVLFYVVPLDFIITMIPIDPTRWTLVAFYFLGGLAIIIKYTLDIKKKLVKQQ